VATRIKTAEKTRVGAIVGDLAAVEEMFALKDLLARLGVTNVDARQDGSALDPALGRASYLFNATIAGIDEADAILLIGTNPRLEAPVLNARIRKRWRRGSLRVGLVGERADLTYGAEHIGAGADSLTELVEGKHSFARALDGAAKPLIIVGAGALARSDGAAVLAAAAKLAAGPAVADGWNGLSVLHSAASRVGALDLGLVPGQGGLTAREMAEAGALDVALLLGADEIDVAPGAFVVYVGTHGDRGAHRADVVLPGAAYVEKTGLYVNTEGRVQLANRATFPPGEGREDWAILRALSEQVGATLPYDTLAQLRAALFQAYPHMAAVGEIAAGDPADLGRLGAGAGSLSSDAFRNAVTDFYLTNPIARASAIMAEMSALRRGALAEAAE
ncbi:MAG TPA: molybdopterin-dependent oxidoreductase, partial [Hansschlegelia sp.]